MQNIKHSQNFLKSKTMVQKIVSGSGINKGDTVIEIGPGTGMITDELILRAKDIFAIELDKTLFAELKEKYRDVRNLTLINTDFLTYDMVADRNCKVFANIPFNRTSEILQKLFAQSNLTDMYLIMQAEAMYKYAGLPFQNETFRSIMYKPFFDFEITHNFSPYDFEPFPKAKVILAHISKKATPDIEKENQKWYFDFVASLHLAPGEIFLDKTKNIFTYEQQKRLSKELNLHKESLISTWTYKQWLGLFNCFCTMVSEQKKRLVYGSYKKLLKQQSKLQKDHRTRRY